jgi:hypothetical protein
MYVCMYVCVCVCVCVCGLVTKIVLHCGTFLDNLGSNSGVAEHSNPQWCYAVSVLHQENFTLKQPFFVTCMSDKLCSHRYQRESCVHL